MTNNNNILNQYKESKRIIRQAMDDHLLVLFVGAGASIASGMPSWSQAVKIIADRLSITDDQLDYLRIPQYYFNARGKKEYTQLMRTIFRHGDFLPKHEIHNKIIEFNTETIVTTNYDHLIEQAAEDSSQIISVVSKDTDLPYRKGGKELIKMHGDFENDNFVLKEDDYLSYSRNFKLIENYVKSLIGTKVVLFVGYSFNDPDLKLIFSWVKDILGGDFQRAYLLESGSIYDVNKAEYFKNFGINVLYASVQLQENFDAGNLTNNLLFMLKWLLTPEDTDKLTGLYNDLKPFTSMMYASQKYVRNTLYRAGIRTDGGVMCIDDILGQSESDTMHIFMYLAYEIWERAGKNIVLDDASLSLIFSSTENMSEEDKKTLQDENNRRIEEYFKDFQHDKHEWKLVREIVDVLCKSNILCIKAQLHPSNANGYNKGWLPFIIPIHHSTVSVISECMEYVNTFNFKKLEMIAEDNSNHLSNTKPDLYMQQAYIQFVLGNYLSSYNCYKNAKSIYYKRHEYIKFFIAEFNRYIMGMMITQGNSVVYGIDPDDVKTVKEEFDAINLDKMFNSLPDLGETNRALKDLYTFNVAYSLFRDAYKSSEKVLEQAKTNYFMFGGTAAFSEMRESISDYYNYISLNMLPVNSYSEHVNIFRIYFQSILNSVMSSSDKESYAVGRTGNVHAEELQAFDVLVALKFVEENVINKTIKDYNSNLQLSNDALKYTEIVISNCAMQHSKRMLARDTFWKCIVILAKSNLTVSTVEITLKKMLEMINFTDYISHSREIINFVNNAHKQNYLTENVRHYFNDFICNIFEFLIKDKSAAYSCIILIRTLLWISKEQGEIFDRTDLIEQLITDKSRLLCANIYSLVGENSQKAIKDAYSNWKIELKNLGFEFYYALLNAGIIKPDKQAEKEIFDYYNKKDFGNIDISNFSIASLPVRNDRDYLYCLLDLYTKGQVIDTESCKKLIIDRKIDGAEWLMDYNNFDYSAFDINWLTLCSNRLLDDICKNITIKERIREIVEKEYKTGNINPKIVDIYFEYFVK